MADELVLTDSHDDISERVKATKHLFRKFFQSAGQLKYFFTVC